MTRDELSELDKRIAASVARGEAAVARQEAAEAGIREARRHQEEAMARQDAATARIEAVSARMTERLDRQEDDGEDLKTFIRNMNIRSDKIIQEFVKNANTTLVEMKAQTERLIAGQERSREEHNAIMEAIFTLIDRLPPPSPA